MKRTILFVMALLLAFSCTANADFGAYPELKKADDFVYDLLDRHEARCMDFKVSEPATTDSGKVYPVELGFIMADVHRVAELAKEMEAFKGPEMSMRPFALSLSVTAESRPKDGKVLFFCTMLFKLTHGPNAEKQAVDLNLELVSTVFEQIKGEPGVKKKVQVEGVNTWLTNLRVSTEKSGKWAQMTGYAFSFEEVGKVCKGLLESGKAPQTMLYSCNSNTYYGFPVVRFDMATGDGGTAGAQVAILHAVTAINDAVEVANTSIQDLRISPAIKTDKSFEYPMEISFKQMEIDQWEQVKAKLSAYSAHGARIGKIGELKALGDEGSKVAMLVLSADLNAK